MEVNELDKVYTANQVAKLIGVKYQTLKKRLYVDSKLPDFKKRYPNARKFGRQWIIPASDINLFKLHDK